MENNLKRGWQENGDSPKLPFPDTRRLWLIMIDDIKDIQPFLNPLSLLRQHLLRTSLVYIGEAQA